jgi:hypothetical protein
VFKRGESNEHLILGDEGLKGVTKVLGHTDHGGTNGCRVDGAVSICAACASASDHYSA